MLDKWHADRMRGESDRDEFIAVLLLLSLSSYRLGSEEVG